MKMSEAIVNDCISAIKNEISIDKEQYSFIGFSISDFSYAPRPARWLKQRTSNKYLIHLLKILRFVWGPCLGRTVYSFYEIVKIFGLWLFVHRINHKKSFNYVAFGFSEKAYELVSQASIQNMDAWISVPWRESQIKIKNANVVSCLSFTIFSDFVKAFFLSEKVYKKMRNNQELSSSVFHHYIVIKWLLVRLSLDRINFANCWMAEHFDRWAVLLDSYVEDRKDIKLHLVQHGTLASLGVESKFAYSLPYKLRNVTYLYVFNEASKAIFLENVLCRVPTKTSFYKPILHLSEVDGEQTKVLVVGHRVCEVFHLELIKMLNAHVDVQVFYKPHPLVAPSENVKKFPWNMINDKSYFPRVDIVVSYPSTLAEEYQAADIPVVVHCIDADKKQVSETYVEIVNQLMSLAE